MIGFTLYAKDQIWKYFDSSYTSGDPGNDPYGPRGPAVSQTWVRTLLTIWLPHIFTLTGAGHDDSGPLVSNVHLVLCLVVLKKYEYFSFPSFW